MKTKIYNTIYNALIIDDNDTSAVKYQKSDYTNNMEYKPDLSLVYDIFQEDPDGIFKCNTGKCLTLIFSDGSEIPLSESTYKPSFAKDAVKPVFLKVTNDLLTETGNEMLISLARKHYISNLRMSSNIMGSLKFNLTYYIDPEKPEHDLGGYTNCQKIILKAETMKDIPAISYCHKTKINCGNTLYQGYLPSAGQLYILMQYKDMLNYIFKKMLPIGIDEKETELPHTLWSSTEFNDSEAWYITHCKLCHGNMYGDLWTLPFFKKIN